MNDHALRIASGCVTNFGIDCIGKSKFGARLRHCIDRQMPFWLKPHRDLVFWCFSHAVRFVFTMVLSQEIIKRVPG
jgi:hypothetical protein